MRYQFLDKKGNPLKGETFLDGKKVGDIDKEGFVDFIEFDNDVEQPLVRHGS